MNNFPAQQRGAALVTALAILVIVTLLAVSSMCEVILESRIIGNAIEQIRLQNVAESGLREDERCFVSTPHPPEPGIGCMADNVACPCLLDLTALKLKLAGTHQNPVGALKDVTNIWTSCRGSDITSTTTADMLYSVQWNNLLIPSGDQINETESPEYGNLMRDIGTFYYEANSVAHNQINSETVPQAVLARPRTN